jgi:hypothetical protein
MTKNFLNLLAWCHSDREVLKVGQSDGSVVEEAGCLTLVIETTAPMIPLRLGWG